jgi:phage replication O-like protein O
MASPQVENGYTRIANELLEALACADLNGTQFRLMLTLIRETYGRRQLAVKLSYTRLASMVKQPRTVIGRNLHDLITRGFITQQGDGDMSEWKVQKDYERWLGSDQMVTRHQSVTSDQTVTTDKRRGSDHLVTRGSDHLVTQLKKDVKKERNGGVEAPPPPDDQVVSLNELGVTDSQAAKVYRIFGRSLTSDEIARSAGYLADGKRGIGLLLSEWLYKCKVPPGQHRNGANGHSNGLAPPPVIDRAAIAENERLARAELEAEGIAWE